MFRKIKPSQDEWRTGIEAAYSICSLITLDGNGEAAIRLENSQEVFDFCFNTLWRGELRFQRSKTIEHVIAFQIIYDLQAWSSFGRRGLFSDRAYCELVEMAEAVRIRSLWEELKDVFSMHRYGLLQKRRRKGDTR